MTDKEFEKQINEKLNGKWNMLLGHRMCIRVGCDKNADKIVRERLERIALNRNLNLKIENFESGILPDSWQVTFEQKDMPDNK